MNYFLLALAIAIAFIALLYTANIIRVALGQIRWASNFAAIAHIIIAPTAGVSAWWLLQIAVSS